MTSAAMREEVAHAIWPESRPTPHRNVRCRHCRQENRVSVPRAVLHSEKVSCGRCGEALFLAHDAPLLGLSPDAYQHSLDRRSTDALASVPGISALMRWYLGLLGDRSAHLQFMADAILCGEDQFPELIEIMDVARKRLDIGQRPSVFLGESPHLNAMTTGVRDQLIVVRSALLDQLDDDELIAVLGHELGHLHADHPLYHSLANALLSGAVSTSPTLGLLGLPLRRILLRWSRCAELTADRAALLASRDLPACLNMMLIFAGGNRPGTNRRTQMRLAPFVRQCRELARMHRVHAFDGALGTYMSVDRTHPNMAWRVMHLIEWMEHGTYLDVISGHYPRRRRESPAADAGPRSKRRPKRRRGRGRPQRRAEKPGAAAPSETEAAAAEATDDAAEPAAEKANAAAAEATDDAAEPATEEAKAASAEATENAAEPAAEEGKPAEEDAQATATDGEDATVSSREASK